MTPVKLLPLSVAEEEELPAQAEEQAVPALAGTIRIKLAGQTLISVEGSVDPESIRAVLECQRRVIAVPASTRIWIAAGVIGIRRLSRAERASTDGTRAPALLRPRLCISRAAR